MIEGKVLVAGATGDTGRATVDALLERGASVRALARVEDDRSRALRGRGVEVVVGDLLDFGAIRAALAGARRAYFVYPIRPGIVRATAQFAQAAKEAGVDGVVNMSQISARPDARSQAATQHWLAERVFDWSGLAVAHIRPTYFAEWLLYAAPMIRRGRLHVPFGTGRHAPIAARDMGRVVAGLLEDPEAHRNRAIPLFGPVEYSYAEIAEVLARVLGRPVEYAEVSLGGFLGELREAQAAQADRPGSRRVSAGDGATAEQAAGDAFLFQHLEEVSRDHQAGIFAGTSDAVERIGGRPPMGLEAFIAAHRAAFE